MMHSNLKVASEKNRMRAEITLPASCFFSVIPTLPLGEWPGVRVKQTPNNVRD